MANVDTEGMGYDSAHVSRVQEVQQIKKELRIEMAKLRNRLNYIQPQ